MSRRSLFSLLVLVLVLGAVVALRLSIGPSLADLGADARAQAMRIREQRVAAGIVVGAALAVAGAMLQSLLRNPLASPDLLGLASGAGLGVMASVYAGGRGFSDVGVAASGGGALVGAMATLALVYLLSQRRGLVDPISLVLVGVIVSIMCGAGTMLLAFLMPDQGFGVARWTFGALSDDTTPTQLRIVTDVTILAVILGLWFSRAMDAAALGEDEARSVGVPIGTLRLVLFVASGVLTAGAVVLAGPIGFVGLVCPHVVRLLAGPAHGPVILGSALAGAILIVSADTGVAALKALDPGAGRMPIGILTALVGGPVLVLLLRKEQAGRTGLGP